MSYMDVHEPVAEDSWEEMQEQEQDSASGTVLVEQYQPPAHLRSRDIQRPSTATQTEFPSTTTRSAYTTIV